MALVEHAEKEMMLAGIHGSDIDDYMRNAVLELVKVFAAQGHSGTTAGICVSLFEKLARYENLTPLSGEDEEWMDVSEYSGGPAGGACGGRLYQNVRVSHVFKEVMADGSAIAYDIDGAVFVWPDGSTTSRGGNHSPVVFPYTPPKERRKVPVDEEGNIIGGS